jgi:hypothetical protein
MPEGKIMVEKRGNPRLFIKIPVLYRLEEDERVLKKIDHWRNSKKNGYTLNISLGGMLIAVDEPLKVGNVIKFEIFLFDKTNKVEVYANVMRVDEKGAGLQFLMMKNEEREFLKAFLDKNSPGKKTFQV